MADPTPSRTVRRVLWLAAGVTFGVLLGFAAALSQPRDELAPREASRRP